MSCLRRIFLRIWICLGAGKMLKVRLSMGEIHYTESGEGPPLLLLHANPGDARDWEAVVPDLSKRFRVIALDWPGYAQYPCCRTQKRSAHFGSTAFSSSFSKK
ncbi:MAG: alpha/beta fold hydrolase [Proteobacteria bacterium]|nr:alpha/beta fold hydrolase [Pseudomonadota bacterium]